MRTMISDILGQAGFEIVGEAETGSQAVEKYKQLKPDLVTMDIVMPDMRGIDGERAPASPVPVGGLFRAVHTVKGMAATMGYARVTDVAHRTENLLDLLRRGSQPATDDLLQLLFRARDSLEQAVELSVVGREDEIDAAEILADLDGAAAALAGPGGRPAPAPGPAPAVEAPAVAGRLVQVTLRSEAPL